MLLTRLLIYFVNSAYSKIIVFLSPLKHCNWLPQEVTATLRSSQFLAISPLPRSITWTPERTTPSPSTLLLVEETAQHPALPSMSHTRQVTCTPKKTHTNRSPILCDSFQVLTYCFLLFILSSFSFRCWLTFWNGGDGCEGQQCDREVEPCTGPHQGIQSDWGAQEWTGAIFHWGGGSRYGVCVKL